jgi:hypothetical protein
VVRKMIERIDRTTLNRFAKRGCLTQVTLLATDEHPAYGKILDYQPEIIRHGDGVYVRGNVHINSIESFWSFLRPALSPPIATLADSTCPLS